MGFSLFMYSIYETFNIPEKPKQKIPPGFGILTKIPPRKYYSGPTTIFIFPKYRSFVSYYKNPFSKY